MNNENAKKGVGVLNYPPANQRSKKDMEMLNMFSPCKNGDKTPTNMMYLKLQPRGNLIHTNRK